MVAVGVRRIILPDIHAHDELYLKSGDPTHIPGYRLLSHHLSVAELATIAGEFLEDGAVALLVSAALGHDLGKLVPECREIYRQNRSLTQRERRIMARHPIYSRRIMQKKMEGLRAEDQRIIHGVCVMIRWHHKPWWVLNKRLRIYTWVLMFVDTYVAIIEDRHVAGRSKALAWTELLSGLPQSIPGWARRAFADEIGSALDIAHIAVMAHST